MSNPYKEIQTGVNKTIRIFSPDALNEGENDWHRDKSTRLVEVLQANGWKFQFDNEIPFELVEGDQIFIPKEHFHRIIGGDGELVVEITEEPSAGTLTEARKSTLGKNYEAVFVMKTERKRNKTEIISDLRAIQDVTVVSITPDQTEYARKKTAVTEETEIKIKFLPGTSAATKIKQIEAAAFGKKAPGFCVHKKIDGLLSLIYKTGTLKAIKTY